MIEVALGLGLVLVLVGFSALHHIALYRIHQLRADLQVLAAARDSGMQQAEAELLRAREREQALARAKEAAISRQRDLTGALLDTQQALLAERRRLDQALYEQEGLLLTLRMLAQGLDGALSTVPAGAEHQPHWQGLALLQKEIGDALTRIDAQGAPIKTAFG